MDSELVARRASDGLQFTLRRLASLGAGITMLALTIGAATFATGLWIFDGSGRSKWMIIGGFLSFGPAVAATVATWRVRRAADHAPGLLAEIKTFSAGNRSADVLVDYDSGQPVAMTGKSLGALRLDLDARSKEFPALAAGVKAITTAPKLVAMAALGMMAAGALGTILLIGGLID